MPGIGIIILLAVMLISLPMFLLDLLMGVSLSIGLVLLIIAIVKPEFTHFLIFPYLLIATAVFRMAINVSSTRLILLQGSDFDGLLVQTFGEFVSGENYVIGFIIFLVMICIQIIIIKSGLVRFNEVAAQFSLDALPGKKMTIDSDLQARIINEEKAIEKRQSLGKNVKFYGQMNRATKFIQIEVWVGLAITAVNIIIGIISGIEIHQETFDTAAHTYILLAIGDGLVALLPSLLTAIAAYLSITSLSHKGDFN